MRNQKGIKNFVHILLFFILVPISVRYTSASSLYKEGSVHLYLCGVVVSEDASSSVAVLKEEKNNKLHILKIGDRILDFSLTEILENRIVFRKNNKTYPIFLNSRRVFTSGQSTQNKDTDKLSKDGRLPTSQKNDKLRLEFVRSDVEERIQEESLLIMENTKFVPYQVDGRIKGIKITELPKGTILTEIGIQPNDIIKKVNGIEINNVANFLDLYSRFEDDNRFEVLIERAGRLIRVFYTLK